MTAALCLTCSHPRETHRTITCVVMGCTCRGGWLSPPETVEELPASVRVEALRAAAQVMATHEGNVLDLADDFALWIATGKRP